MQCDNCGAAMALVTSGPTYFQCAYCGSFHFPVEDAEGIVLLRGAPDGMRCPACGDALVHATVDRWPGDACPRCRGVLLRRGAFEGVLRYRRSRARGPGERLPPADRTQLQRTLCCPSCGGRMETHPYYGPGNFVIDNCYRCHLVWLDHGELQRASTAAGDDRGRLLEESLDSEAY